MSFENFPYSNFHELNLDWIVQKLKEAYSSENPPDYPVKSVNGMTGDVIIAIPSNFVQSVNGETGDVVLYRNPLTQFPATDEVRWNLFRICDGTETGIQFDENGASRIEGIRRIKIYDEDNPPDYPVTSVNGQTGDVQITAGVQSVNGKTGNVVTPFVNPNTDILTLDSNSPSVLWGISRNVPGGNVALYITTGGTNPQAFIRYIPDGGQAINLPLLTNADIPDSAGVVSVNGKTGAITLYSTDILLTDTSQKTINNAINKINSDIKFIYDGSLVEKDGTTLSWRRAFFNVYSGEYSPNNYTLATEKYINKYSIYEIVPPENMKICVLAWENDEFRGLYNPQTNIIAPYNSSSNYYTSDKINLTSIVENYPSYDFAFQMRYNDNSAEIPVADANQLTLIERYSADINLINSLETRVNNNDQQISALQTSDTTQNDQISALQTSDTTQNNQISALQTSDTTQNNQISALQASDTTQNQQIAELYTRIGTGIKEATISEVVTLPARYPTTGLDNEIKSTSKCMLMELSRPGVQHSEWTIETFDGYLTITGTIRGLTDITLYLI